MVKKLKKVLFHLIVYHLVLVSRLVKCNYYPAPEEHEKNFFSIVGSKTLRINEPYEVAVTSHRLNAMSETVTVGIEGTSFRGENYSVFQDVKVNPGATKIVKLLVRILIKI